MLLEGQSSGTSGNSERSGLPLLLPCLEHGRMGAPAARPALPVEADELPIAGSGGQPVLPAHSLVLVAEEPLPGGAVALGDGGDVELLRGHFSEGPRVPCRGERRRLLLQGEPGEGVMCVYNTRCVHTAPDQAGCAAGLLPLGPVTSQGRGEAPPGTQRGSRMKARRSHRLLPGPELGGGLPGVPVDPSRVGFGVRALTWGQVVRVEDSAHLQDSLRLLGHLRGATLGRCRHVQLRVEALLALSIPNLWREGSGLSTRTSRMRAGAPSR